VIYFGRLASTPLPPSTTFLCHASSPFKSKSGGLCEDTDPGRKFSCFSIVLCILPVVYIGLVRYIFLPLPADLDDPTGNTAGNSAPEEGVPPSPSMGSLWGLVLEWAGLAFFFAFCRTRMRQKLGLSGSFLGDFCTHCCCNCCALAQEARHVKAMGLVQGDYGTGELLTPQLLRGPLPLLRGTAEEHTALNTAEEDSAGVAVAAQVPPEPRAIYPPNSERKLRNEPWYRLSKCSQAMVSAFTLLLGLAIAIQLVTGAAGHSLVSIFVLCPPPLPPSLPSPIPSSPLFCSLVHQTVGVCRHFKAHWFGVYSFTCPSLCFEFPLLLQMWNRHDDS
jgi:Cys-rich protein (TIGR01571 family)